MKIFVIGGKAKTGKSTFGKYLMEELKKKGYKPCVMHLTEPLYNYAKDYFSWDEEKDEKPREFLQHMGIEIIKEKMHKPYFLINRTCEDIEILSNFFDTFIITDARLIMEFTEFNRRFDDVVTIKLERENYNNGLNNKEENHITETEIDDYTKFSYIIKSESLEKLREEAIRIVREEK